MPKQQSSLHSFFGVPGKSKPKKQKTLTSFFRADKENDGNGTGAEEAPAGRAATKPKNPTVPDGSENKEEGVAPKRTGPPTGHKKRASPDGTTRNESSSQKQRRRLVIDDSDSDKEKDEDEDEEKDNSNNRNDNSNNRNDNSENDHDEEMKDAVENNAETKIASSPTSPSSEPNKKTKHEHNTTEPSDNNKKKEEKENTEATTTKKTSASASSFFAKPKPKPKESDSATEPTKTTTGAYGGEDTKHSVPTEGGKPTETKDTSGADNDKDNDKDKDMDKDDASMSPGKRRLVRRARKLAKAYKVDVEITKGFPRPTLAPVNSRARPAASTGTGIVPYGDLAELLERIEGVSGRLEIQAMATGFFRRILKFGILPVDLSAAVYLSCNAVAPAYECVELGIGDSLLVKAISEAYGSKPATIKEELREMGDLGLVARSCKSRQRTLGFGARPKPLTMEAVLAVYREIAAVSGSSSQKLKVGKIKKLLVAARDSTETKFLIRGLQGKLRIGLAQSTVLVALAHALAMTIPSTVEVGGCSNDKNGGEKNDNGDDNDKDNNDNGNENGNDGKDNDGAYSDDNDNDDDDDDDDTSSETDKDPIVAAMEDESLPVEKTLEACANMIKKVYSEVPSYDALLEAALEVPLSDLHKRCHFQPGIPVEPMLAKPTKSIQEVLKRLDGQEFTCEYKYDGERAQIHKTSDGSLKVFSRNLLETSSKYPEVPLFVQEAAAAAAANRKEAGEGQGKEAVDSFVLDAEVVAYDHEKGQLVPFQVLSTRKKTVDEGETSKVQVIVQAFDLMYLNGKSLLGKTLKERRELLKTHFAPVEGRFQFAKYLDAREDGDTTVLEQFLDAAVKGQCEGLMVKTMVDIYEPSRRSLNWLKLKKDYLDGVGDSFDLVPLGAYYGRGKRTGVYGAYLLACYDPDTEEFQSVCKIGTGFSDEDLQSLSKALGEHELEGGKSSQYVVSESLEPDVWFDAVQVWEVKAADLSKSSTHKGALGKLEEGRGIGLRFPRFERVRDDKRPDQATSSDQVLDMYYNQDSVKGQLGGDGYDDGYDGI